MKNLIILLISLVLLASCQPPVTGPNFDDDKLSPFDGEGKRITYRYYSAVLYIDCDTTCKVSLPFYTFTTNVDSTFNFYSNTACNRKKDGVIKGLKINGRDVPVFITDTVHIDTVQVGDERTITYDIICDTVFFD